jgi:hypothetical protein
MKIGQSLEGGGRYEKECEAAYRACEAEMTLLIVHNGKNGDGFSVVGTEKTVNQIPRILRAVADAIEESQKQAKTN